MRFPVIQCLALLIATMLSAKIAYAMCAGVPSAALEECKQVEQLPVTPEVVYHGLRMDPMQVKAHTAIEAVKLVCERTSKDGERVAYRKSKRVGSHHLWILFNCRGHKLDGLWRKRYYYEDASGMYRVEFFYNSNGVRVKSDTYKNNKLIVSEKK